MGYLFTDNIGNVLGLNNADNLFDSSSVVANADGSLLERIEYLQTVAGGSSVTVNSMLGTKVTRAAADIIDGTQTALFTVATGRVLITHISAEVSGAAVDNTASNCQFLTNPTVGTDAAICAVLDVDSDEEGTIYSATGEPATAMTGGSGGGANSMFSSFIVAEGSIDFVSSADAGTGGALLAVEVWYIPLDSGATVTAA